jgi:hypothetical protein
MIRLNKDNKNMPYVRLDVDSSDDFNQLTVLYILRDSDNNIVLDDFGEWIYEEVKADIKEIKKVGKDTIIYI